MKQGGGTLALGGSNTYSGNTFLNNGVTQILVANSLPTGTTLNLGQSASVNLATLDLNGNNQQIAGINSTAGTNASAALNNTVTNTSTTTSTLTIGGSGSFNYGSATTTNSGIIAGNLNVVKSGSGTQILGGVNTYTGSTTVNAGTLVVNGSLAATSAVTVNNGGTLAGKGTVQGALTLNSGGTVTPGTGSAGGNLTIGGNLTLNGGSSLNFQLSSVNQGQLVLSGNGVSLIGGNGETVTINLTDTDGSAAFGTYTLLSVVGTSIDASQWNPANFSLVVPSEWSGSFLSEQGNNVLVNVIPEPSAYAAMFGGVALAGAVWVRRRRRSRAARAGSDRA